MPVHDPDHSNLHSREHLRDLEDLEGLPPGTAGTEGPGGPMRTFSGQPVAPPAFIACCNCLFEYRYLPGMRCPRCGADHAFSVPRHDFFPVPATAALSAPAASQDDGYQADTTGKRILYVGIWISIAIVLGSIFTNGWALWLAGQFASDGVPAAWLVTWLKYGGAIFGVIFFLKSLMSLLGWNSGHYFYRNYVFRGRR